MLFIMFVISHLCFNWKIVYMLWNWCEFVTSSWQTFVYNRVNSKQQCAFLVYVRTCFTVFTSALMMPTIVMESPTSSQESWFRIVCVCCDPLLYVWSESSTAACTRVGSKFITGLTLSAGSFWFLLCWWWYRQDSRWTSTELKIVILWLTMLIQWIEQTFLMKFAILTEN